MKAAHSSLTPLLVPVPSPGPSAALAKRVNVADRAARSFAPTACMRGYQYFARKRVDLQGITPSAIDAEVKGKRTHHTSLRVAGGKLAASCTCSPSLLGPAACRHVWATLLEVDRQSLLESLRATERPLALDVVEAKAEPAKAAKSVRAATKSAPRIAAAPAKAERSAKTTAKVKTHARAKRAQREGARSPL